MFPAPRRRGGNNLGLLLLAMQIGQIGLEHIPPVTLAVVGICTAIQLQVLPAIQTILSHGAGTVCMSYPHILATLTAGAAGHKLVGFHALYRIFTAPLVHLSDMHLYYNMASWLAKARWFERRYGSTFMAIWLFLAMIGTTITYTAICAVLHLVGINTFLGFHLDIGACCIGLSAVLFCLKTVLHSEDESRHSVFFGAFTTQAKYAVWFELLFIQFFSYGHVSFLGHLAGILCGVVFNFLSMTDIVVFAASRANGAFETANQQFDAASSGGSGRGYDSSSSTRFHQRQYNAAANRDDTRSSSRNQEQQQQDGGLRTPLTEEQMQQEARARWAARYDSRR